MNMPTNGRDLIRCPNKGQADCRGKTFKLVLAGLKARRTAFHGGTVGNMGAAGNIGEDGESLVTVRIQPVKIAQTQIAMPISIKKENIFIALIVSHPICPPRSVMVILLLPAPSGAARPRGNCA
jgi:hypothetical protein